MGAVLVLKICPTGGNPPKSDDGRGDSPRKNQALDGAVFAFTSDPLDNQFEVELVGMGASGTRRR
jgi:hypothetical protein